MRRLKVPGTFWRGTLISIAVIMVLAACHSGPPQISIANAKAVMSPAIIGEAIATMDIENQGGSDVLKAVKTDIPGANASFHVLQGQRMVSVDMMEVLSRSSLHFKMGGSHIMIENMPAAMKAGSQFNLMLVFEKSGEKMVPLTLEPAPSMPMGHDHAM